MGTVQIVSTVVAVLATAVAALLFGRAVVQIVKIVRLGQPDPTRIDHPGQRVATMLRETLGHTRMLKWTLVGAAHWFVFIAFGALIFTLIEAYGEVVDPHFELPLLGGWTPYGIATELIALLGGLA